MLNAEKLSIWIIKKTIANTVYNSLLVQAYLRKSSRISIRFVFAKLVAETRNEIIHQTVGM